MISSAEIRMAHQSVEARHSGLDAAEPAARGRYERSEDVVAETRAQRRPHVADGVSDTKLDRLRTGPVFAGEHGFFWALESRSTASLHEFNEIRVDLLLHRLEPRDVLRVLRQERVEHRLVLARRIEPPLDAELVHEPDEAERAADHSDRADDRGRIADDLVTRHRRSCNRRRRRRPRRRRSPVSRARPRAGGCGDR